MFTKEMGIQKYLKTTLAFLHLVCIALPITPAKKSKSDIDIELKDQMEDEEYLNILHKNLKELNKNKYDFVFYVAGVDVHFEDRLGKLKITDEGINKRDQIVIENFYSKKTPLCGVLGGGYNRSFEKLIELHSMLHKNCANYFS